MVFPINKPQTRDVLLHMAADSGIINETKKDAGALDFPGYQSPTRLKGSVVEHDGF